MGRSRVKWDQTYSSRFERWLHLLAFQFLPVDVAEEAVVSDVSLPLRTATQPLRRMLCHQLHGEQEHHFIQQTEVAR